MQALLVQLANLDDAVRPVHLLLTMIVMYLPLLGLLLRMLRHLAIANMKLNMLWSEYCKEKGISADAGG